MAKLVDDEILLYFKQKMDASVDIKIKEASPYVGDSGNWVIGGVETDIPSALGFERLSNSKIESLFPEN